MKNGTSVSRTTWVLARVMCALLVMHAAVPVFAHDLQMSDDEMVLYAGHIIEAQVVHLESEWNPGGTQIYTYIDLNITRTLKGDLPPGALTLRVLGGVVDEIGMAVGHAPNFDIGEEVLLLLGPNPQSFFPVVGMEAGKFTKVVDDHTGRLIIRERGVLAGAFINHIESIVADHEAGFFEDPNLEPFNLFGPLGHDDDHDHVDGEGGVAGPLPNGFRVEGGDANQTATALFRRRPSATPPFLHWDLREFPSCEVPYSLKNETGDLAAGVAFAEMDEAFDEWTDVVPAHIIFDKQPLAAGAMCPLNLDGHNLIGWNIGACAAPGNDVWLAGAGGAPACGNVVAANVAIIGPGPGGWLTTIPNNCYDDVCLVGGAGCECGAFGLPLATPFIGPGPNGALETVLNNCPGGGNDNIVGVQITTGADGVIDTAMGGDDQFNGVNITSGANGVIETAPNGALPVNALGLTAVFYSTATGAIIESDVLLNDAVNWVNVAHKAVIGAGKQDVWSVTMHEIGHMFGLHHPTTTGDTSWPNSIMEPMAGLNANHTLNADDQDGINFIYTYDLGDAPPPYPTFVQGINPGRTLNGVELNDIAEGAAHLYGILGPDPAIPRYQYEWLGDSTGCIDDDPNECDAVARDACDDGVTFAAAFIPGGGAIAVTVDVRTANDRTGNGHVYNGANQMYLNAWFDWNADGDWLDAGEYVIGPAVGAVAVVAAGPNVFAVTPPAGAVSGGWARFRLDYLEDVDQVPQPYTDPTLSFHQGLAHFGEVEDYQLIVLDHYEPPFWQGLAGSTFQVWDFPPRNDVGPLPDHWVNPFGVPVFAPFGAPGGAMWFQKHNGRPGVWRIDDIFAGGLDFVVPNLVLPETDKDIVLQVTYFQGTPGPPVIIVADAAGGIAAPVGAPVETDIGAGWTHQVTRWRLPDCPAFETITILPAAPPGSVTYIDRVIVDTICDKPDELWACCIDEITCQDLTEAECTKIGGTPMGEGTSCAEINCANFCGNPAAGDCCLANGTPACDDVQCCNSVCAGDAFCCDTEWDQLCADTASIDPNCNCGAPGCGNPAAGDCCLASDTPFCENADCCNVICAADPFCCDTLWDQLCADTAAAEALCNCAPTCTPDLTGDGLVNAADLAQLLGSWGPCPGCPEDLNGDNVVNAADLATMLGAWGPCP